MEDLENKIRKSLDALITQERDKGTERLSLVKLELYINNTFNIEVDTDLMNDLLSDMDSVSSLDGDIVNLGSNQEKTEEEENNDEIEDIASDQALDNLTSESYNIKDVLKLYENIKLGDELNPYDLVLEEGTSASFLNNGAKKAKTSYIVTELKPGKTVNESYIKCKLKDNHIFIDLPITALIKK